VLALLPLLTLLLLLLREALLHLFELPLELLGLAAQRLLLPTLAVGQTVAAVRAIRELLLPASQLLQLGDELVLLLLRRILVEADGRLGLVLVLLEIHLELEELAQVAAGCPAAAAAALLEGDLDVRERSLGAQQMLQRVLLARNGLVEIDVGEPLGRRIHRGSRLVEGLDEFLDARVGARQAARARAARERARLLGQRALQVGEHLRVVVQLLLVEIARGLLAAFLDEVPGRDEDFLLPPRDLVLLLLAAATAAATAALPLREVAVERLDLDEEQVGLHLAAAILGHGVVRDDVTGLERAELRSRSVLARRLGRGLLGVVGGRLVDARQARPDALLDRAARAVADRAQRLLARRSHRLRHLLEIEDLLPDDAVAVDVKRRGLPFAAVDRVANLDAIEAEVVVRLDADRDFLDVARAPVAAGLHDLDDRLVVGNDLDEIVVRELHGIAVEQRRDVVLAVFRDLERRAVDAVDGRHRDALAVDDELRRLERLVRRELDGDLRAFDGADVVAGLDDLRLELRPVRIVVRELQARDARQVDDVDRVLGATQARRGDVVPHRLAQREEREIE